MLRSLVRFLGLGNVVGLILVSTTAGTTLTVRQDGTGDYANIQEAAAAAAPGDTISVGPGTYAEGATIDLQIPLVIFSTAGPEQTILTGDGQYRILQLLGMNDFEVRGFSFVNGRGGQFGDFGGGIVIAGGANAIVEDCVFREHVTEGGSAIYVSDSMNGFGTSLVARDCLFEDNRAEITGGAVYVVLLARAVFERCTFRRNVVEVGAGAVHAHRGEMDFMECLFQENLSDDIAGGLYYGTAASGAVQSCTFVDHRSPGNIAGTIVAGAGLDISHTIIVGDTHGYGIRWYTGVGDHSCNVYWKNADGAMGFATLDPSEQVADPLFCGPDDFHLMATSPAAPGMNPCGLIGAFEVACGPVHVEPSSWAQIKAHYR